MRKAGRLPPAIEADDPHGAVRYDLFKRVRPLIRDIRECNLTLLHWAQTGGATPAYLQELRNYINSAWPPLDFYRPIPDGWAFSTVAGSSPEVGASAATLAPAVPAPRQEPAQSMGSSFPSISAPRRMPVEPGDKSPAAILLRNTRQVTTLKIIPRLKAIATAGGVTEAEATRAAIYIGLAALEKDPDLLWKAAGMVAEGRQ